LKRVVLALLASTLVACSISEPPEDATGEEIYRSLCSNCHGDDLSGGVGPALGPGSFSSTQPDEFLVITIEHGRGSMPSFSSTLDDEQVLRLVAYLREVQEG
jgi:mono/diheme cytochrome c family protein